RADYGCGVKDYQAKADRIWEVLDRNESRHQRLPRWTVKGNRRRRDRGQQVNRPYRCQPESGNGGEDSGAGQHYALRDYHQTLADKSARGHTSGKQTYEDLYNSYLSAHPQGHE